MRHVKRGRQTRCFQSLVMIESIIVCLKTYKETMLECQYARCKTDMKFIDDIRKKYHNMNDSTRKDITDWCKSWDNDQCQHCSISFAELEVQAQMNEEMGGKPRILPVFTVDHRDNDSTHNDGYIDVDSNNNPLPLNRLSESVRRIWHKYGNCRRLCWSCNRIQGHLKRHPTGTGNMTQEKTDRINNENRYLFEVETQINEREHVCYKAMIKAGKAIVDSSEVTCQRYIDTAIITPENPSAKFMLFSYTCDGKFCNGTHVTWANIKPDVIIREELAILEREWEMIYALPTGFETHEESLRQWKYRNDNLGKKWISKEEYIRVRLKKTWD